MDSSFRWTRYAIPDGGIIRPSRKDIDVLSNAFNFVRNHDSGGSYSMAAVLRKSKPKAVGFNSLYSPAILKNDIYPELCGVHAELNLWMQYPDMTGCTVYITGVISKSRNLMSNTIPCIYCAAILEASGARYVVCYMDNKIIKVRTNQLLKES